MRFNTRIGMQRWGVGLMMAALFAGLALLQGCSKPQPTPSGGPHEAPMMERIRQARQAHPPSGQ